MNIIFKNSLKNIFGKPFRTLLVGFAIFMCCLCAMLCFDMGGSLTKILTGYLSSVSRADFLATSTGSDLQNLPDGFPEADTLNIIGNSEMLYKEIDGEYCFVTTDYLSIYGLNVDEAEDMEFMAKIDIADDEMYVSKDFADAYGYKAGDKITVHDRNKEEVELTIGGVFPDSMKNPILQSKSAVVNMNTAVKLACGDTRINYIFVDVHDNTKIEDAKKMFTDTYADVSTQDLFLSDSDMKLLDEIKAVFYLMFVITFLLVIFVTASICNRIVNERMSFIGTLRSLGMSTSRTARILLLENVIYALFGSLPAVGLYSLIRDAMLGALFSLEDESGASVFQIPPLSGALVAGVILMAIIIECLIPLKAIMKALKTSIRDIIFDNRDTEYRFSRSTFILGLVSLAIAIVTFFFRSKIFPAIICLITAVAALAFLFPRVLKLVTTLIKKFSDKHDKAAWSLAASEAISRKSTVGSGVLSATAAAMCIIVYAVATAMGATVADVPYDCDVVMSSTKAMKYYSYIDHMDGVTDVEPLYFSMQEFAINEEETFIIGYFYALPDEGYKYFTGFDYTEKIEDGNILVDKKLANRKGISEGDEITVTINPTGVFPKERKYTVQAIVESNSYDGGIESLIVSESEYKALFLDYPGMVLISCEDPDAISDQLSTYAKGAYSEIYTKEGLIEQNRSDNAKTRAIITTIITIAVGMTAIGMISNQLIGFEGRKKECAVLLSTAMGRGKLSGILFKEVLITSITASAMGVIVGSVLTFVISAALKNAESLVMDITVNPAINAIFFVVLTLVFTLTVLFPIKNLRKMKISEQIKYE